MKGRTLRALSGKIVFDEPMVVYPYRKGGYVARRLPALIVMPRTWRRDKVKSCFGLVAATNGLLPKQDRRAWGFLADSLSGGAAEREKHMVSAWPWFMRPHSFGPPTWSSARMYCNLLAAHSDMSYPRDKAPIGVSSHPNPSIQRASYNPKSHTIQGELFIPPLLKLQQEVRLRLFVAGQYVQRIPQSIHRIWHLGPGPTEKPILVRFRLKHIRCAGFRFNQENLEFRDMAFGELFLFADVVSAAGPEYGPLVSAYSNVETVQIPPRGAYRKKGVRRDAPKRFVFHPGQQISPQGVKLLQRLKTLNRKYKKAMKVPTKEKRVPWEGRKV